MLCDIISAVAEFMVRVLHSMSAIRIHNIGGIEAGLTCGAINVVKEFMVDVGGIEAWSYTLRATR
jgi:hypothetical protein